MRSFKTHGNTGAAEVNRTPDPVITNEWLAIKNRSFSGVDSVNLHGFCHKLRKKAQKYVRKLCL